MKIAAKDKRGKAATGKHVKRDRNTKTKAARTIYPNPVTQSSTLGTGAGIIAIIAVLAAMAAFITPAGNGFIDFFNLQGFYAGLTWVLVGGGAAAIAWILAVQDEKRGKL